MTRDLRSAYQAEMTAPAEAAALPGMPEPGPVTVRGRAIAAYLAGDSACQIAAEIGRTTTPASITKHLRDAGLGGLHWCPLCRTLEQV